jgi:hypothetical protein
MLYAQKAVLRTIITFFLQKALSLQKIHIAITTKFCPHLVAQHFLK